MVIEANDVQARYNLLALLYNWALLSGFIIFPPALAVFRKPHASLPDLLASLTLIIAILFSVCGAIGIARLWHHFRRSRVWLIERLLLYVFLPRFTPLSYADHANSFKPMHVYAGLGDYDHSSRCLRVRYLVDFNACGYFSTVDGLYHIGVCRHFLSDELDASNRS